ncbi:3-isopropylmalate dehydratase small subunit [Sphingobium sp. CR2-8]|uniref:3-isopropylmalate dehydratase small subunit n=1 Tax=Sphingobium sp. CR2-8 TaxID=1306534 RepID=UPI002DBD7E5B|nr:3-isopropylmalate dehydratase small subunit [Sphingobium sp. CR2-8]MEC3911461.1 3-isopropylmalate dehydratase small subunit [Sphingobium sp. CR2-8]
MTPLVTVTGQALSLPDADVDTDIIYPARFLLITEKKGLGRYAFHDRRDAPGFPLAPGVETAPPILIAGPNFGCGSSREQAPWALAGLGIRVIIAESFGEIFFSNCFKNGQLPICFDSETIERLRSAADATVHFAVSLDAKTVTVGDAAPIPFEVDDGRREALLNGWNDIARIRALHGHDIAAFEAAQQASAPWLWTKG